MTEEIHEASSIISVKDLPENNEVVKYKDEVQDDVSIEEEEFEPEDFEDESIAERIIALKEILPESLRNKTVAVSSKLFEGTSNVYSFVGSTLWYISCISTMCFFPLMIELERAQFDDQQAAQQRTMMMGPSGAAAASNLQGFQSSIPQLSR